MRIAYYKRQFKKDYKKLKKQYGKQIDLLHQILNVLILNQELKKNLCDHGLEGAYKNCRELHIKPDWLLIYQIGIDDKSHEVIYFIRSGSHSDLF
jgi:mRNA interferase YafQ